MTEGWFNAVMTQTPCLGRLFPSLWNRIRHPRTRSEMKNLRLVERRSQRNAKKAANATSTTGKAAATQQAPASHGVQGSGPEGRNIVTKGRPELLPKFHQDDFVIVIKPRASLAIRDAFHYGELGTAFGTFVGAPMAAELSLLFFKEKNLILSSTRNAHVADRLLGDFSIKSAKGDVRLRGHLKQHEEDVCYGVITVATQETSESLQHGVQWRNGTVLDIRMFCSTNKARLTFAGTAKPRFVHYNSEIVSVQPYLRLFRPAVCVELSAIGRTLAPTKPKISVACLESRHP
ncbi:hypothetical protein V5799_019701 [Amblyomma americanum]|uniref:Uncharacterized protein n=1 Tax=Amblyomma americanum TaxID=6943 RepID=A0AAQ4EWL8_AMBAM